MRTLLNQFLLTMIIALLFCSCEKEASQNIIAAPVSGIQGFAASATSLVLSSATDTRNVVTFSFNAPDYGVKVVPSYTLQFDVPSDTSGVNGWANAIDVKLAGDSLKKTFLGADFNALLSVQLMLPTGTNSTIVVRLRSEVKQNSGLSSTVKPVYSVLTMTVNPYKSFVEYPALMVKGGNSWRTPATRTNGLILTSAKFNAKYEGYLDLPNADGWGGDAFTLVSSRDAKVYGWGTSATTLSEGGGNLWLSPSPNHMKVNVDLDALTITYTPVKFFISGDDNAWSLSGTPMVYNAATKVWTASNVALTAGKTFVFTVNGGYEISYKLDKAENGSLMFAGAPAWGGVNIPVAKTGVFTVTLDMSAGDGNYTYSVK
ncbi:SusE domain-containing protein [Pedobacter metabolipauper]|uniref:SusE-like outer membrane protein n=1 Tax=Pedobacter metabolipauper TaxID=425513 RepID=A0A4R6SX24_9SPHI|nr:SusE domain-containing protein [Pedobacter metabolipauper]TDQ11064.1 SusE-like outer membrane protein [Pedobacter metabolipauper]